ncbi:divalent metal ion transporter [Pelomyxa schiedti]|nr:divalent metal ion transporter [Pelomyxa schiedti]
MADARGGNTLRMLKSQYDPKNDLVALPIINPQPAAQTQPQAATTPPPQARHEILQDVGVGSPASHPHTLARRPTGLPPSASSPPTPTPAAATATTTTTTTPTTTTTTTTTSSTGDSAAAGASVGIVSVAGPGDVGGSGGDQQVQAMEASPLLPHVFAPLVHHRRHSSGGLVSSCQCQHARRGDDDYPGGDFYAVGGTQLDPQVRRRGAASIGDDGEGMGMSMGVGLGIGSTAAARSAAAARGRRSQPHDHAGSCACSHAATGAGSGDGGDILVSGGAGEGYVRVASPDELTKGGGGGAVGGSAAAGPTMEPATTRNKTRFFRSNSVGAEGAAEAASAATPLLRHRARTPSPTTPPAPGGASINPTSTAVPTHNQARYGAQLQAHKNIANLGVPSTDHIGTLSATLAFNIVFLLIGMSWSVLNLVIAISAPLVAGIIYIFSRQFAPHSRMPEITIGLALACCLCSVLGFSSSFIGGSGISMQLWLLLVFPLTYPFFIAFGIVSTVALYKLKQEANNLRSPDRFDIEDDINTAKPATLYWCVFNGQVLRTSAESASIVVFINPSFETQQAIVNEMKIDQMMLDAALDPHELSRVEYKENYMVFFLKFPHLFTENSNISFQVSTVGLFLFRDRLVIFMQDPNPILHISFYRNIESLMDVVIQIVHQSILGFTDHVKTMHTCTIRLESDLEQSTDNTTLVQLFSLEKSFAYFLSAIASTGHLLSKLCSNTCPGIGLLHPAILPHHITQLESLSAENAQCYQMVRIHAQVVYGLTDCRSSIITNNLNRMMKNLNAMVIAITIPTFFASVGGMSEFSNMIGSEYWELGYPLFIVGMFFAGMGVFLAIKKVEPLLR